MGLDQVLMLDLLQGNILSSFGLVEKQKLLVLDRKMFQFWLVGQST